MSTRPFVLVTALAFACSAPPAAIDGGSPTDATTDATSVDSAVSDTSSPDAAADAGSDAAPVDAAMAVDAALSGPDVALVVARTGTDLVGARFDGTAWSGTTTLGTGDLNFGLATTVLQDGAGLAVILATDGRTIETTAYAPGTGWGTQAAAPFFGPRLGLPIALANGDALLPVQLEGTGPVEIATWDRSSGAWLAALEPTGLVDAAAHAIRSPPALALGATGDALVVVSRIDTGTTSRLVFARRTGGTWSPEAPLPGSNGTGATAIPRVTLVSRLGGSEIVALWNEGTSGAELRAATFAAGTWSAPATIGSDLLSGGFQPFVAITLPDQRIAVAYLASAGTVGAIAVATYDGTWSAPRAIPGVNVQLAQFPLSVGRGLGGAALEVAYLSRAPVGIAHVRLTDEAAWTWTTPTIVDGGSYDCLAFATGP